MKTLFYAFYCLNYKVNDTRFCTTYRISYMNPVRIYTFEVTWFEYDLCECVMVHVSGYMKSIFELLFHNFHHIIHISAAHCCYPLI